jgi:ubiquinone/menaquinone biosynthesis C-methylase UbiE
MSLSSEPYVCEAKYAGWLTTPVRRLVTDPRRMLRGLAAPGDVVMDVGCGPGYFTLPLAEMVGDVGSVLAVDLQAAMLDKVRMRAQKAGLLQRIRLHRCGPDSLGLEDGGLEDAGPLDFALAFWMIHEVPDRAGLLAEVFAALRPGGRLLAVEPKGHVGPDAWSGTLDDAAAAGFAVVGRPRVAFSRAALLERPAA